MEECHGTGKTDRLARRDKDNRAADDGLPGARHHGCYRERARGGAGMIVAEPMPVHPAGVMMAIYERPDPGQRP